jgi:glycosyltransferase involved in cell wall biosynthesis
MIKVLMLSPDPYQPGGVADYVGMLKANLPPDIQVESLFTGRRGQTIFWRLLSPFLTFFDALRLLLRLLYRRYDVVHLNPSFNKALLRDSLFMLVLRVFGLSRVLVFIHGWNDEWSNRVLSGGLSRALFRWVWGGAGRILLLASRFKQSLVDAGFDGGRIQVVSTMFDAGQFEGVVSRRGEGPVRVLFLSRFVREKGGYELLEGFAQVAVAYPETQLTCAGDGPEAAGMRAWVERQGLGGRVRFPGFVRGRDKAQLLADADIFAFPTYYGEGCPVSLLEAMAAGCAVISGDAGGIPDVFVDGVNGLMLSRPTGDKVGAALRELLANLSRCRAIGAHNREVAGKRFEAGRVSADVAAFYAALAGNERRCK